MGATVNNCKDEQGLDYFVPLLKEFCEKTLAQYDKVYDQGPFIPYTMANYDSAPVKIMYVGRDTYYWEPVETLKKAYQENKLENYLKANANCVDVDKMLTWKNNSGSFWNMVDKLHLLIRTGKYYTDITSIGEEEINILKEIGYGNLHSIELLQTLAKRYEEPGIIATPEYLKICKAAKPFEMIKSIIEAYPPHYIFVFSWIEKNDFFDDTDFLWQENMYIEDSVNKKYRAVYLSKQYKTKVIWTLHPNALWRRGFKKEDVEDLIQFLARTYNTFESQKK